MSCRILKWNLSSKSQQLITIAKDAEILTIQLLRGAPVLYARTDPENPQVQRGINIAFSGPTLEGNIGKYITTLEAAGVVAHFFDAGELAAAKETQQ